MHQAPAPRAVLHLAAQPIVRRPTKSIRSVSRGSGGWHGVWRWALTMARGARPPAARSAGDGSPPPKRPSGDDGAVPLVAPSQRMPTQPSTGSLPCRACPAARHVALQCHSSSRASLPPPSRPLGRRQGLLPVAEPTHARGWRVAAWQHGIVWIWGPLRLDVVRETSRRERSESCWPFRAARHLDERQRYTAVDRVLRARPATQRYPRHPSDAHGSSPQFSSNWWIGATRAQEP